MPFGSGNSLKIRRSTFRQNLIQDMQNVAEGRIGSASNASLIQSASSTFTNVISITRNGSFIATVGDTVVGDLTEKVGAPTTFELGG